MLADREIEKPDRSLPEEYRAFLPALAGHLQAAGIRLAVLFGSRARGDEHPRSDMDIGVLAADGRPLPLSTMGLLATDLSKLFSAEVDVSDLSTPDAIFRFEVARTARILFESQTSAFAEFLAKTLIDYYDIQPFLAQLVAGVARRARQLP